MSEIKLSLPLPPSPNQWPNHHMELHRQKNHYRRQCWGHAVSQSNPPRDPPEKAVLAANFRVERERDQDNLAASLKWVLDCLKQEQTGKLHWRQGIADQCGYFVDDDPDHLAVLTPTQEVVSHKMVGLDVTIFSGEDA